MIKLIDILKEINENQNAVDKILDKISAQGLDSLTPKEKEYLTKYSKGEAPKNPDEYLQDLFKEWKEFELKAGFNDIEDIYYWGDLYKFDPELKDGFLNYTRLVKKYPNLDKEDLATINSAGHIKTILGDPIYEPYSSYDWNSLDEKTYDKILYKEFGIEPYKDEDKDVETDEEGNLTDAAYIKEFGFSWEEKQNWEKILNQVEKKYKFNVFSPKSLKNHDKIKEEAKNIYIKKYGSPKYKKYPFG